MMAQKNRTKFHLDVETKRNENYRKVVYTGAFQLVLMSLEPGQAIGLETHDHTDQFFRIEEGRVTFKIGDKEPFTMKDGDSVIVPAGTKHNVKNPDAHLRAKLYTIYAPPQHKPGTLQPEKPKKD